jgi:cytochrome c oxidase subunit 2
VSDQQQALLGTFAGLLAVTLVICLLGPRLKKGWGVVFGLVLLATFLIWFIAPFFNWWLPENVSSFGGEVDQLFYVILGFTSFFFILTEVILVYAMWKYSARDGEKAHYTHGNHRLELIWTAVPAAILLFIAFAQVSAWGRIKYQSRMPAPDLTVSVLARQWEWRIRVPVDSSQFHWDKKASADEIANMQLKARAWAENPQADDVHLPNELHCWAGTEKEPCNVKLYLRTLDVIHSFTLPNLRLKQDTLPGKTIPMWFQVTRPNTKFDPVTKKCTEPDHKVDAWEISCQELCGARHYAMRGRLYVHPNKADYEAWLKHTIEQQQSRQGEKAATPVALGN